MNRLRRYRYQVQLPQKHSLVQSRVGWRLLCGLLIGLQVGVRETNGQGLIQIDQQKLQQARQIERRALAQNDSLALGKAYFTIGEIINQAGSNSTAKEYYLKAFRTLKPIGDSYELGLIYLRLTEGLELTQQSVEDIDYAQKALGVFERIQSPVGIARAHNYLTSAYKRKWLWLRIGSNPLKLNKPQYDTLVGGIRNIERFARLANDTTMLMEANLQYGDLFRHLRDKRAIIYLEKALHLSESSKNDTTKIHTLCHLASAYIDFGQPERAYTRLMQAKQVNDQKQIKNYWLTTHLYETLKDHYLKTDNWQKACDYLILLSSMYSYRIGGEKDNTVMLLNLKHDADQQKALMLTQQTELANLRLQQRFVIVTTILSLLTGGLSIVFFRLYRKNQRISRRNAQLVQEQNHRVKNNLQIVSSLLNLYANRLTDPLSKMALEESKLRVETMAVLQRRLYDRHQLASVDLRDFASDVVEGVLKSYDYAHIDLNLNVPTIELSIEQALPVGLILNELTTNACKYAFPDTNEPEFVVCVTQLGNRLELNVSDNGPGLSDSLRKSKHPPDSFGLRLIQMQTEQLNGSASWLADKGTHFQLTFSIHTP